MRSRKKVELSFYRINILMSVIALFLGKPTDDNFAILKQAFDDFMYGNP